LQRLYYSFIILSISTVGYSIEIQIGNKHDVFFGEEVIERALDNRSALERLLLGWGIVD
jgi:hypothetical protein